MWYERFLQISGFSVLIACSSAGSGGEAIDAGASGFGGTSAGGAGGTGNAGAGGTTSTGGGTGGAGGTAGVPEFGGASGVGGSAGATTGGGGGSGGSGGAPPMCASASECSEAMVSYPGSTDPPTSNPTDCVGGQCGLIGSYNGSYQTPKTPRSCDEICAASTYEGKPMVCSPMCNSKSVNGFGDKGIFFGGEGAGVGTLAGLVTYQFSTISGAYEFVEVGCAQVPTNKLIQGSNSYKYVQHHCCCTAP